MKREILEEYLEEVEFDVSANKTKEQLVQVILELWNPVGTDFRFRGSSTNMQLCGIRKQLTLSC